jgi:hypothetical protein
VTYFVQKRVHKERERWDAVPNTECLTRNAASSLATGLFGLTHHPHRVAQTELRLEDYDGEAIQAYAKNHSSHP